MILDRVNKLLNAAGTGALASELRLLLSEPVSARLEVVQELLRSSHTMALTVLDALTADHADPDPSVRWTIVKGLERMQNSDVIRTLKHVARSDPDETVRTCAISTLGERARAAFQQSQPGQQLRPTRGLVPVRGTIQTRGQSRARVSEEARQILDILTTLREVEPSDYVRDMADLTLRQLGE